MSILKKLAILSASIAFAVPFTTLPAAAQSSVTGATSLQISSIAGQFRSRGHSGFRGSRGFSRRGSSFSRRGSSFNRGFRGSSFNRGFRGSGFNRGISSRSFGSSGFRGSSFNRGFSNSRFRGSGFNRGFSSGGFRSSGFKRTGFIGSSFGARKIVRAPIYAVGGFYGFGANSIFIDNFGAFGLYAPPVGYRWVCDKGSNDAVLAAIATGAIIAVVANALATPY